MPTIAFKDVDFFGCNALNGQSAKIYIRNGKAFMYVGDTKYVFEELEEKDRWVDGELPGSGIPTQNLNFSKDYTYEGVISVIRNSEGYLVGVFNPTKRIDPVVIRLEKLPVVN